MSTLKTQIIKMKNILLLAVSMLCISTNFAQDKRAKIKDYLNKEILIEDVFAGQSITLIKENKDYFILRKYFGSGVPVIDSVKYDVVFKSAYQIEFSKKITDSTKLIETFRLGVEDRGLTLYLNGLRVFINEHFAETRRRN